MFLDRKEEIGILENHFAKSGPTLMVIYGRRRVGKTFLIREFSKDKRHLYFLGDMSPDSLQLTRFTDILYQFTQDSFLATQKFDSWDAFFQYLEKIVRKEKVIVVIDELPYLIFSNPAVPSILQRFWDTVFKDSRIFLILCGSYLSIMEQEVLGYKSPLYGRRTGQLLVQPMDFFEFSNFFPSLPVKNRIEIYSITGGIPVYITQFKSKNLWREIKENILSIDSFLYNEIPFLLNEELREPRNYFAILQAIASGRTKLNEITQEVKINREKVNRYIDILRDLRIVERNVPITEKIPHKSRRGIYKLTDNYFSFWFRYVYPFKSYIEEGRADFIIDKRIKPFFDIFVSQAFEEVAKQYLRFLNKKGMSPFEFFKIGSWWNRNEEIDIVAIDEKGTKFLFGECKWSSRPVGIDILEDLQRKAEVLKKEHNIKEEYYFLFSKSGFTENLKKVKDKRVRLISVDEIKNI